MRTFLKSSEKALAATLPTSLYFRLQDRLRPLLDPRTTAKGRTVQRVDNAYEVRWSNGDRFRFPHKLRYCRYMHRSGLRHILDEMLNKYQDSAVQIEPGDVVVEVGANVGEFTLAALRKGATVYAAEPDPSAFACLSSNAPAAMICPIAIGNRNGVANFFISTGNADSSAINEVGEALRVEMKTLASWVKGQIDFLKVEAEGFEPEVLAGADLARIRKIAIDCGPERHGKATFEQCEALLKGNFKLWRRDWMLFASK